MPGIWLGRSGGIKRVKTVRSGRRPARAAATGKTLSIHGVGQGKTTSFGSQWYQWVDALLQNISVPR
jgi:hypothetical protein